MRTAVTIERSAEEVHPPSGPRCSIVGGIDADNFGYLLFPLIASWRLARYGIALDAFAPAGEATRWLDAAERRSMDQVPQRGKAVRGFLIGGGNIVHALVAGIADHSGSMRRRACPGAWVGMKGPTGLAGRPVVSSASGGGLQRFDGDTVQRLVHPDCASDVPDGLVAMPDLPKQAGLLEHAFQPADRFTDCAEALAGDPHIRQTPLIPDSPSASSDGHWQNVAQAMLYPQPKASKPVGTVSSSSADIDGWKSTLSESIDLSLSAS